MMRFHRNTGITFLPSILVLVSLLLHVTTSAEDKRLVIYPAGDISRPTNKPVALTCFGPGQNPNLYNDLKWFDPRNEEITDTTNDRMNVNKIGGKAVLTFYRSSRDDSGEYRCTGTFQGSEKFERKVKVTFYIDITWDDCPVTQVLVKGENSGSVRCKLSANPPATIRWYKDETELDGSDPRYIIENQALRIRGEVIDQDRGKYRVEAIVFDTGNFATKTLDVNVYTKPKIVGIQNDTIAVLGQQARFSCRAEGIPMPLYSWFNKGKQNLSNDGSYVVDRQLGLLTINNVRRIEDNGEFSCKVENAAGFDQKSITVTVLTKPRINSLQNITGNEGSSIAFECRVSGDPMPQITFRRGGDDTAIQPSGKFLLQKVRQEGDEFVLELKISSLQKSDGGLYYCSATNEAGGAETAGHLLVNYGPKILNPRSIVKSWGALAKNITCGSIVDAVPNATVRWFRDDKEIRDDDTYHIYNNRAGIYSLQVKHSQRRSVYGRYRCFAKNDLGDDNLLIELKEAFVPSSISSVTLNRATANSLEFKIFYEMQDDEMPLKNISIQYKERRDQTYRTIEKQWIHVPSPTFWVKGLKAKTEYQFRFVLGNEVGPGPPSGDKFFRTLDISVPNPPAITLNGLSDNPEKGDILSDYSDSYTVKWSKPEDNGRPIDYYLLKYYEVERNDLDTWKKVNDDLKSEKIDDSSDHSFILSHLKPQVYYFIELRSHNSKGLSESSKMVFRTNRDSPAPRNPHSPGSVVKSRLGLRIIIIVAFILLMLFIMDMIAYGTCHVGFTHYLRNKLCKETTETHDKIPGGDSAGDGMLNDENAPMMGTNDFQRAKRTEPIDKDPIKNTIVMPKDSAV